MNGVNYKMQTKSSQSDHISQNRITNFLNSINQSMTEPSTKRIAWIDMAKAIAILLMVIGHEASGNIYTWIFSFHMPLFFILSGYGRRSSGCRCHGQAIAWIKCWIDFRCYYTGLLPFDGK